MAAPVIVVDSSDVRPGRERELREALGRLVAFVDAEEAEPLAYGVYFDEEGTRMTVVQVHPSSESMERHLAVAAGQFSGLEELLTLRRVDFYGAPSDHLVDAMRRKAESLGGAAVVVNQLHAGFSRLAESVPSLADC